MTSFMDSPLVFGVERLYFSLNTPRVSCRLEDSCLRLGESAFSLSTSSVSFSLEDPCLQRGEAAYSLNTPRVNCSLEDPCLRLGEAAFSLSTSSVSCSLEDSFLQRGEAAFRFTTPLSHFEYSNLVFFFSTQPLSQFRVCYFQFRRLFPVHSYIKNGIIKNIYSPLGTRSKHEYFFLSKKSE